MATTDQPATGLAITRDYYVPQMRIASGLILFTFAITHFINHGLGLVSLGTMDAGQQARTWITESGLGSTVLILAAVVHFVLGIAKFMTKRTWRLGTRNVVQLIFGLLIPILLIRHVVGTRGVEQMYGVDASYTYALWAMWPAEAVWQSMLMTLVWVHSCIGIHHWLIVRSWYQRHLWLWYGLAVIIPALAYAGYVSAGRIVALESAYQNPFSTEQYYAILSVIDRSNTVYYVILGLAVAAWLVLLVTDRFARKITVSYANGPTVSAHRGLSLLEVSRINRIPHASVCGGRARCSTCRVRVVEGLEDLPPASETEVKVLKRVAAPANVRLACQLRPTANLTISTLMPGNIDAARDALVDRYHWGVEQEATILFCDLRGFTKMSEGKLSYDVVFLLNQFLGRMAESIQDCGGYVDKFMGDGIMAIFGMDTSAQDSALSAIEAARAMGGVLDGLNQSLREELPAPLQIGIGLNTGPVVLGRIGAGHRTDAAARITALGETVNTASRLEGLTKGLEVQVIVADTTLEASGLSPTGKMESREVDVRGLSHPVAVYSVKRATDLPSSGNG